MFFCCVLRNKAFDFRYNTGQESNTVTQIPCLDGLGGECPSCVSPAKSEVATLTSRLACGHEDNDKDLWSSTNVARAQRILLLVQLWISCCRNGGNQGMRNSDLWVEQQEKSRHNGNYLNYVNEYFICSNLKELCLLRAGWSYLRNLFKNCSRKFMMV